jgi:cell division protein FtsA
VIFDKPVRIGSPEYVGAASPMYVNAVGIVVHAANNAKVSNNLSEQSDEHSYENKSSKKQNKKGKNGFASKVKEFFADFF